MENKISVFLFLQDFNSCCLFKISERTVITYIGLKQQEFSRFRDWVIVNNGYFEGDDGTPRQSKRVRRFPLEIKVRGLLAESVVELIHGEIG